MLRRRCWICKCCVVLHVLLSVPLLCEQSIIADSLAIEFFLLLFRLEIQVEKLVGE